MGADLGELVIKRPISLENLSNKIIAVDAFNVLYQFLSSIRQADGTPLMDFKGNITAHLSGLFYRSAKLLEEGIKLVYVFDGEPSSLKEKTISERAKARSLAREKWAAALEKESLAEAKRYAQAASHLSEEMVEESKELLSLMGIPWVQAPGEGEAQAAVMASKGIAYAVASQDYDCLLFGAPIMVRNISITGRRRIPRTERYVIIEPEEIRLRETLSNLGITREELIIIAILIGTDFNDGVRGIGPKTALKIVKKEKNLKRVISYVKERYQHEFEVDPEELVSLFKKPRWTSVKRLEWKEADEEGVVDFLAGKHDFSEERVRKVVGELKERLKERSRQKNLSGWI